MFIPYFSVIRTKQVAIIEAFGRFDKIVPAWEEWGKLLEVPTNDVLSFEEIRKRGIPTIARPASDDVRKNGQLRILAVDDDPVSLKLLVRHLQGAGQIVRRADHTQVGDRRAGFAQGNCRIPRLHARPSAHRRGDPPSSEACGAGG